LLIDYRLQHGGTANHAKQARPLLYLVYSRPWFRDHRNFKKQSALLTTRASFRKMDAPLKQMLRFAEQRWF
jgi:hypothetical protein